MHSLFVEVNIGGGSASQTPKIAVCHWDNPQVLATEFCRIFSLNDSAIETLTEVILNNMRENGICVFGDEIEYDIISSHKEISSSVNRRNRKTVQTNKKSPNSNKIERLATKYAASDSSEEYSIDLDVPPPPSEKLDENEEQLPHHDIMNWLIQGASKARAHDVEAAQNSYMSGAK